MFRHQIQTNIQERQWRILYVNTLFSLIYGWWHKRALHTFFLDRSSKILSFNVEIGSVEGKKLSSNENSKKVILAFVRIAHSYYHSTLKTKVLRHSVAKTKVLPTSAGWWRGRPRAIIKTCSWWWSRQLVPIVTLECYRLTSAVRTL